jgi:hypothetical protein
MHFVTPWLHRKAGSSHETEDRRICPGFGQRIFPGQWNSVPISILRKGPDEETGTYSASSQCRYSIGGRNILSTLKLSKMKTGSLASWVVVRWDHLQEVRRRPAMPRDIESHHRAIPQ